MRYSELHPIQLPSYPTLDTPTTQPGPADTNMSADGTVDPNLSTGDPTPMEVESSVNTEVSPHYHRCNRDQGWRVDSDNWGH